MKYEIKELGVSAILDQSIKLIQENFKLLAGIIVPFVIPFALIQGFVMLVLMPQVPKNPDPEALAAFYRDLLPMLVVFVPSYLIFVFIIVPITNAAMVHALARVYLQQPTSVGQAFMFAAQRILPLVWTWFLSGIAILGGMLLCLVPGILAAFWFALVTQIVVLEGLSGFEALKRSRALMKGNIGKLFLLGLIVALINGSAGGIAGLIPQPHIKTVVTALIQGLATLLGSATSVIFYFSARCQHENFDLTLLAEAVGVPEAAPDAEPEML